MSANQSKNGTKKNNTNTLLIIISAAIGVVAVMIIAVLLVIYFGGDKNKNGDKYISIAKQYIDSADYDNAIKSYWAAIEIEPTQAEHYVELGQLYEDQNDMERAWSVYRLGYQRTLNGELLRKYQSLALIVGMEEKETPEQIETTVATTAPTTTALTTTEPVTMVTISGKVASAVDGHGVEGVRLYLESTDNAGYSSSIMTNTDGDYSFEEVPFGDYMITTEKEGYINEEKSFYIDENSVLDNGDSFTLNIVISPKLQRGEIRFVLTWNAMPYDLDAHLEGISSSGAGVHVYFSDRSASDANGLIADLDCDDISGYGPETLTLYDIGGTYEFYVVDYTHSGTMSFNGASVKIYTENQAPIEVTVPADVNNVWSVCRVSNGNLEITNYAAD